MNRPGHEDTDFFLGHEVEQSPAFGLKTLFVVGLPTINEIQRRLDDPFTKVEKPIEHIYFGANHSFPHLLVNNAEQWRRWELVIQHFLDQGYWCTLDFDFVCMEGLIEGSLVEHHRFIPMISVKMPYLQCLGYNAVLKLDDKDFAATNPGVWCHSVHDLTGRKHFTPWYNYQKDTVL